MDRTHGRTGSDDHRRGSTLVLVLVLLLIASFLGMSLLFTTDVDLRTSVSYDNRVTAMLDADSAIQEVIWRMNLLHKNQAVPTGSLVSVNSLVNYDAYIDVDPQNILGNSVDDDLDGEVDESDELSLAREWQYRLLLTAAEPNPGFPHEVTDSVIATGPPWGSRFVEASVQPEAGWKTYSTADPAAPETLRIRFKLDTDTIHGDSEGDGPEIVFWDPDLAEDTHDSPNTLSNLGFDGDPRTDTEYNITWSDGVSTYPATGNPVILVEAQARVLQAGEVVGRRRVQAELVRNFRRAYTKAMCGCVDLDVTGGGNTDSYRSSEGDYGTGPIYQNGDVGSNGDVKLAGGAYIGGDTESGSDISFSGSGATVNGDALAVESITGPSQTINGEALPGEITLPDPCACDAYDVDQMVLDAAVTNDNATAMLPGEPRAYKYGTTTLRGGSIYNGARDLVLVADDSIILTGGDYYFDSVSTTASAVIQAGTDSNSDGIVDGPPTQIVRIFVAGDISLGGQGLLNASNPTDLEIYAATGTTITYSGGSEFRGSVYAPGSRVDFTGGATVKGAVVGGEVKNSGGSPVHFDEDLMKKRVYQRQVMLIAWRELD